MFYGSGVDLTDMPIPRKKHDLWMLKHEESPKNNDYLFSHEEIMTLFNYTSTFKRESDYPVPTQFLPNLAYLKVRSESKQILQDLSKGSKRQTTPRKKKTKKPPPMTQFLLLYLSFTATAVVSNMNSKRIYIIIS